MPNARVAAMRGTGALPPNAIVTTNWANQTRQGLVLDDGGIRSNGVVYNSPTGFRLAAKLDIDPFLDRNGANQASGWRSVLFQGVSLRVLEG